MRNSIFSQGETAECGEEARQVMFVSERHNQTCETACLDCLLTFDARTPMQKGLLQRKLAIQVLESLLQGGELPVVHHTPTRVIESAFSSAAQPVEVESQPLASPAKTAEERLQRAQQRIIKRQMGSNRHQQ